MEITIIVIITFISVVLSFSTKALTVQSIFLDIKKKKLEINQMTAQTNTTPVVQPNAPAHRKKSIRAILPDILSYISLIAVSYKLWGEYHSIVPLSREIILNIALLFSLAVFNILSLSMSRLSRRLGHWVDEFITAFEQQLDLIKIIDNNAQMAVENIEHKNNNA